jgi:hypothetical protein
MKNTHLYGKLRKLQQGSVVNPATSSNPILKKNTFSIFGKSVNKDVLPQIDSGINLVSNMFLSNDRDIATRPVETQMANQIYDTAADTLSKINPIAGTAAKLGGFASDLLTAAGFHTDGQTFTDKMMDSKFLNTTVGLINSAFSLKSDKFKKDNEIFDRIGGGYIGTNSELEDAENKADKTYGLFSSGARDRVNKVIAEAKRKQSILEGIADEMTDQKNLVYSMGDLANKAYSSKISGGLDARYFRAESGGKFESEFEVDYVLLEEPLDEFEIDYLEEGGKLEKENKQKEENENKKEDSKKQSKLEKQLDAPEIEETNQKNIIPEGALHKNKHNMENAEDLTKKGIPVVDNNNKQQAEIEKNEIIFNKEVTKKLEELYEIYYSEESTAKEKEEAAIDAGKLITKEIMLNTDDRTGLIDTLKQGGTLNKET